VHLAVKPGSATVPMPGYDVRILDENQQEVASGQIGDIVIKLPLPPGCLPTLRQNDEGYKQSYLSAFPGDYITADAGNKDPRLAPVKFCPAP